DLATIVYTSGTTGASKGVLLTHRNLLAEVRGLQQVFPFGPDTIGLMCLPLAHVIARAMQFFALAQGCQSAFAESLEKLPQNLKEVRPHFMAAVPRLLEKSHEKVQERLAQTSPLLKKMFFFPFLLARKVRAGFGGRLKWIISGGAPLSKEIAQFFFQMGILVLEGYGLTETFAAVTINRPDDFRFGTIGKPLEGIRVKINAEGEIGVKGDTVFSGYLGLQGETEKSFDPEGWFLTGDIGEFTPDGFLKITDRKKDIIVTSSGKNIAPQNIEGRLVQSPYIQQAFVYGDRQRFLSALVTLNWTAVEDFAKKEGIAVEAGEALAKNERIFQLIEGEIERINGSLSRFETVKKFAILPDNFSMESGELTPTLKIKRKVVAERYKEILENFYQS
ncbi:MAG: long-chain fatty acid--CoA ligase, partial [Deltaproteobacteria bacterium]|nr:long-chain fatty acid--CoA ligase [Deltaproteobacteria bacterium]